MQYLTSRNKESVVDTVYSSLHHAQKNVVRALKLDMTYKRVNSYELNSSDLHRHWN